MSMSPCIPIPPADSPSTISSSLPGSTRKTRHNKTLSLTRVFLTGLVAQEQPDPAQVFQNNSGFENFSREKNPD